LKIKQIELVFENCEALKLDFIPYKNSFLAKDIFEELFSMNGGEVDRAKIAKIMQIVIPNEQLLNITQFDTLLLDKLDQRDITSVWLIYDDGTEEEICTLWNEYSEYTNYYQKNEFNDENVVINIQRRWESF
jgi:hypothetical protein